MTVLSQTIHRTFSFAGLIACTFALLLPALTANAADTNDAPVYDNHGFEAPAYKAGPVDSQGKWQQVMFGDESQPTDAVVQTTDAAQGSQAVTLKSVGRRVLIRQRIKQTKSFYLETTLKLPAANEIHSNATLMFRGRDDQKKAALLLTVAFNSSGAVNDIPQGSKVRYTPGQWTRVLIHFNLENSTWSLWLDGSEVGKDMPLSNNVKASQVDVVDFNWHGKAVDQGQGFLIDQITLSETNPAQAVD